MKKETRTKVWMYWECALGLICGLFACVGITAAVDQSKSYDERTYFAVVTVILIIFFKWGIQEYGKARKELRELKESKEIKKEIN